MSIGCAPSPIRPAPEIVTGAAAESGPPLVVVAQVVQVSVTVGPTAPPANGAELTIEATRGPCVAPLTLARTPDVVSQISPFVGDVGATPGGMLRLAVPAVDA